ncbi:MAG TPA: hypothetical protein DIU15_02175, partial [Deltaproteobacteria bacterium]|nr:hypothetical protein [Deltaproteobacteria bacterium]
DDDDTGDDDDSATILACDDALLEAALVSLGTWPQQSSCSTSFSTATTSDDFRLAANFTGASSNPVVGMTWSLSFDGTALPDLVSGSLEVQTGSSLSVNDCNDALDPHNQPAVTQQWDPIAGSATMSVTEVFTPGWVGGPTPFNGSVELNSVIVELSGSPGTTCEVPDTTWPSLYLGWWPG